MNTRPKLFVSYASADRHLAERVVTSLVLNGIQVWYDQHDIDVGEPLHSRIQEGALAMDYLGLVVTPRSLASPWVAEELSLAKQRELEERRSILLPLVFEQVELPLHLRMRKFADFTDFNTGFGELMRLIDRQSAISPLNESLRARVRSAISNMGVGTAGGMQAVRSQQAAQMMRDTGLGLRHVGTHLTVGAGAGGSASATVFVDIRSADASIPIAVDLGERSGSVLARILQAINIEALVAERQRFSFMLLYEGIPLELDETLRDASVTEGAHLELGAYTFLIE